MIDGKMPLHLTAVVFGLLGAALLLFQPYSADWPGTAYADPARRFIRAALRQDSAELTRLSTSPAPVRWALNAGRAHRDTLAHWEHRVQAYAGEVRGDTTEVFVFPSRDYWAGDPIVFRFVGTDSKARVATARSGWSH